MRREREKKRRQRCDRHGNLRYQEQQELKRCCKEGAKKEEEEYHRNNRNHYVHRSRSQRVTMRPFCNETRKDGDKGGEGSTSSKMIAVDGQEEDEELGGEDFCYYRGWCRHKM